MKIPEPLQPMETEMNAMWMMFLDAYDKAISSKLISPTAAYSALILFHQSLRAGMLENMDAKDVEAIERLTHKVVFDIEERVRKEDEKLR
jgi:hypothetical protein